MGPKIRKYPDNMTGLSPKYLMVPKRSWVFDLTNQQKAFSKSRWKENYYTDWCAHMIAAISFIKQNSNIILPRNFLGDYKGTIIIQPIVSSQNRRKLHIRLINIFFKDISTIAQGPEILTRWSYGLNLGLVMAGDRFDSLLSVRKRHLPQRQADRIKGSKRCCSIK